MKNTSRFRSGLIARSYQQLPFISDISYLPVEQNDKTEIYTVEFTLGKKERFGGSESVGCSTLSQGGKQAGESRS